MVTLFDAIGLASSAVALFATARLVMYARDLKRALREEPLFLTCTGHMVKNFDQSIMAKDCGGIRSAQCSDGRCRYHCAMHCKCEAAGPPVGPYR